MPIQYLVLEDTDEVITLVEDKNKGKQIQEDEQQQEEEEEDEDEKENNNQGVQLISEKLIVVSQKGQSASDTWQSIREPLQTITVTSWWPQRGSFIP